MTCIYDAWVEALRIGHEQIQVKKEPVFQQTMFDEYIHVDGDAKKAEKVIRSIVEISRMRRIWMSIMRRFPQRKMHCRQSIISCGLDSPLAAVCLIIIRTRM